MKTNEEVYRKYLEILRLKLIKKYDDLGLRASGKYADELEASVLPNKLIMYGSSHSQFMELGRNPGRFPPIKSILEWIENKQGIPDIFKEKKKQYAFLIARKIANEGIKVPNQFNKGKVIEDVVNDFLANDIDKLLLELGDVFLARIKVDILNIFKELQV